MKKTLNTSALVTADSPKGQRATETFRAQYNKAGLTGRRAQKLNENPEFAAFLLEGIKRFSSDYELAHTILGKNFISPEDVMNSRKGITYTDEQLAQFGETVPAQEILQWCRDNNFVLVAGPNRPMSLIEIRNLDKSYFYPEEGGEAANWWYTEKRQKFAQNEKVGVNWYMICKDVDSDSIFKCWDNQLALISENEFVPNAAEIAWAITVYKAVRRVYLFEDFCSPYKEVLRTSSLDSDGYRVHFGICKAGGINFNTTSSPDKYDDEHDYCDRFIGLSVARKW